MQRVMPAYNEERYIEACIASVQTQDYPAERSEILVADGRSTDRTRELLAAMATRDPRIKIIDNPEQLQAAGLGHIVRAATPSAPSALGTVVRRGALENLV
jgi:succinoglycan biosynthesis protein ExoA